MRLMITGAGGQLGQEMAKQAGTKGHDVIPFTSRELDITNTAAVRGAVLRCRPDAVVNCAAYNAVDHAEREWRRAFLVNGLAVRTLALAAREAGAILVHYSTDYVFDGLSTRPYTIADRPNPISRYGESKLLGEQAVRDHSSCYFLIRTSWVFGPGNTNFAQKVLEWGRQNDRLKIVDDQVSSPTRTRDLADATLGLLDTEQFGLYHLTNGGSCSRYEWAQYILDATGWKGVLIPVKSEEFPTPARRPAFSVLDNFGAAEVLGWELPPWEDATHAYLEEMGGIP
ncbi:MAG: dTDP-4-dehydrorhamnose reductase [Methanoregulaceae archaeon PtaB.Bin056]|nr:MAG: dTDP-4-dehydrorhamnose reductase [Methanoregulaceae archaeon PtaB.Bin056]